MSIVDDYLKSIPEPHRGLLDHIRKMAVELVPDTEEATSYGMPTIKFRHRPLIGFLANKSFLSLFPFSPAVVNAVKDSLEGYEISKGTIRFTPENPIPDEIIAQIIQLRKTEIAR